MPERYRRVGQWVVPERGALAVAVLLLFSAGATAAEDDAYLKQIQVEAAKIEGGPATAPQAQPEPGAKGDEVSIESFEKELQTHYRGSYLFYTKLPRANQEEIFLEYKKGASIDDIRAKIMNRFLHKE